MQKTRKVAEVCERGVRLIMIHDQKDKYNHYKVYRKWWDTGWHKKQLSKWGDFLSAWQYMYEFYWKEFQGCVPFRPYEEATNEDAV